MGSYNISCLLSGTSISPGMEVLWIPLVPTDFRYRFLGVNSLKLYKKDSLNEKPVFFNNLTEEEKKTVLEFDEEKIYLDEYYKKGSSGRVEIGPEPYIVSNDGSLAYFSPVLPVQCVYADYGEFDDIKENATTQFYEKLFPGFSISEFIRYIQNNWRDEGGGENIPEVWKVFSSCTVRKDVFEAVMQKVRKLDSFGFQETWLEPEILEFLGFFDTENEKEPETEDHFKRLRLISSNKDKSTKYRHPDLPGVEVSISEGVWLNNEKIISDYLYRIEHLLKAIDKTGLPIPPALKEFESKSSSCLRMKAKVETINSLPELSDLYYFGDTISSFRTIQPFLKGLHLETEESKKTFKVFTHLLKDNEFFNALVDITDLSDILFCTNRIFMPTNTGPQCGERNIELAFYQATTETLAKKRATSIEKWGI